MRSLKTFRRGGLDLEFLRDPDPCDIIQNAFLPGIAQVLLKQHTGDAARGVVRKGDFVREGVVLGRPESPGSTYVHSPIPGMVRELRRVRLAGGGECDSLIIALEGSFDRLGKRAERYLWTSMRRQDIVRALREKGVVAADGRPLHELLEGERKAGILVMNGLETEPYVRTEAAVLHVRSAEVIEGLRIIARALEPSLSILAFDAGDHKVAEALSTSRSAIPSEEGTFELLPLLPRFPQHLPGQLGEVIARRHRGDKSTSTLILRPSTLVAVYEAAVEAKPSVEAFLTVGGGAVRRPAVLRARIGTPIGDLIEECGGFNGNPERIIMGGPFTGWAVQDLDAPVTKTSRAVLALLPEETHKGKTLPCIRCGRCAEACPEGLDPEVLYRLLGAGRREEAGSYGLAQCSSCGACGYVCPSRLPLVQIFSVRVPVSEAST